MTKKKTSQKRKTYLEDIPIVVAKVKTKKFDPSEKLRDRDFVSQAILEALSDGESEIALEILNAFTRRSSQAP